MKTFSSFFKTLTLSLILLNASVSAWGATVTLRYQANMPSGNYNASNSQTMTVSSIDGNRYYCELSLSANTSYGFFIKKDNNYYKVNTEASSSKSVQLYDYGSSNYGNSNHRVTYKTGSSGKYIFTFDASNNKIVVSPQSETVELVYDKANGHDSWWDLDNKKAMTQDGSNYYCDVDLSKEKYYMFIRIDNTIFWRGTSALPHALYYYGDSNFGNSGDKMNYTPTATSKHRFIWNHLDKTLSVKPFYTVTFDANGHGTAPGAQTILSGTKATEPTAPTATGYTFGGWYKESGCTNKYDFNTAVTDNLTLYAKWTQNTYSYTVTAGEGGTVSPASGTVAQGSGVTITATPNDGYEFDKWTATNGTLANASNATTTFTPSANNANATASFKVAGCTQTPTTPTSLTAKVGGNALAGDVCSGTNVTLTAGGIISVGSLQWGTGTVGDNIIAEGNGRSSITVSPTVTTTYWVRSIITEAGDCYGVTSEAKTLQITITPALVQPVLSKSTLTLEEGGSNGSITITSGTTGGTWTSSDTNVATVNNGTVTPKGPGTATITYTVFNACEADKIATCTVTVNAKPYYIGGRFQQNWNDGASTTNLFTYAGNGRYKLETGKTVAELSAQWQDISYTADQSFFIHTGKGKAGTSTYPFWITKNGDNSGHNFEAHIGESNAIELGRQQTGWNSINENRLMKFTDATDNSSDVVIWWEPSTNKLWYTATANLTTNLYLLGLSNWAVNDSRRFVKDENDPTKAKVIINLAKGEYTKNTDDGFKINDNVASKWYGNDGTMKRNSCTGWSFEEGKVNAGLTADVAGDYVFTLDLTTMKLTVTYPTLVTLSDGASEAVSSSQTAGTLTSVPGQMVTATPTMGIGANGNTLCWKLYDKDQDIDHLETTVDVNFISLGNGKITFELPKVTGTYHLQLTIHAGADCSDETLLETIICPINVSTENTVFFQDESGTWKNVYVYFYGGEYWENPYGSGAKNITSYEMTRINGTNIFYYKYSFAISSKNIIAFTDHDQEGYQWFSSCQVVYRSDFASCAPMFVLDKSRGVHHNNTAYYYTDGYWTTYMGTSSGYWLHIDGNDVADHTHEMTTTTVGKRVYTHKLSLRGNQNPYHLWFGGCNGTNYGVESNMTVTNCTEWNLYSGSESVNLYATAAGDYTFILYCNPDGHFQLSVEFPVAKGDFQLVYDDGQQTPHPSDYIRSSTVDGKSDIVSMYIRGKNGTGKTLKVQRCTGFSNNGKPQWETLKTYDDDEFSGLNLTKDTVYNFHMEQTVSTQTIDIKSTEFYSGKYYVRTKAADGGWDAYATEADNQMTYTEYSSHLPFDPYTHYFCKWVDDSNKDDVSYTIACDYAKALSDTLEGDNYTTTPESHALPEKANVRFTYDNRTNGLKRAYLTGASDSDFDDFLKLSKTKDGTTMKPGQDASDVSHVKLKDEENWVYATEIYVTSVGYSFDAMLTAVYPKSAVNNPEKKQYFFAKKNNDGTYAGETLIGGTDGSEQLVTIRYDFKTNRLMRAWKPSGEIDDEELPLSADILLIREGQNAAEQLVFTDPTNNKITNVKTIFGALEFKYDNMVGKLGTGNWNHTSYRYCRYYVSFPFDVRISEIFGAGNYGEDYIIQKYNGTKRAEIGWFAETETFWETMDKSEKLNKYEGYCVMLNRTPFNDGNSHVWKNKKTGSSVYLYFPSASHKDDWTINAIGDVVIPIPEHQCNIDRYFTQDVQNGEPYPRNHKNTDSHWNMVGTPLFQNATAAKIADGPKVEVSDEHPEKGTRLQYVYDWVNTVDIPNGTAVRRAWNTNFEFKAMHSYLIQYAGEVTFRGSHIANHVPAAIAARRVAEEVKNYTVELQLDRDSAFASRTYVELQENAEDGFLLNEDMYMGSSSPIANLYTYAGAYDVAANVLSVNSHIVPVGVQVKKAGTYTFSMTTPFDGTVTLIDYHTGSRTNLGWSDYTVTLEKGTINDRFALEINIQNVSTDVEGNTGHFKGKDAVKFLHNGVLYIKKGDTIYDARGSRVSMSYEL